MAEAGASRGGVYSRCVQTDRQTGQRGWGLFPGTSLPCRTDDQVARIVAVNGTHRLPDALAPLINVRRGAEGDRQTPNVTNVTKLCLAHTTTLLGSTYYNYALIDSHFGNPSEKV